MAVTKGAPAAVIGGYFFFLLLMLVAGAVEALVVWPAGLYAGLSGEFNFSARVAFVKDFVRLVKRN